MIFLVVGVRRLIIDWFVWIKAILFQLYPDATVYPGFDRDFVYDICDNENLEYIFTISEEELDNIMLVKMVQIANNDTLRKRIRHVMILSSFKEPVLVANRKAFRNYLETLTDKHLKDVVEAFDKIDIDGKPSHQVVRANIELGDYTVIVASRNVRKFMKTYNDRYQFFVEGETLFTDKRFNMRTYDKFDKAKLVRIVFTLPQLLKKNNMIFDSLLRLGAVEGGYEKTRYSVYDQKAGIIRPATQSEIMSILNVYLGHEEEKQTVKIEGALEG